MEGWKLWNDTLKKNESSILMSGKALGLGALLGLGDCNVRL